MAPELDLRILDQLLLGPELEEDVLFDLGVDAMRDIPAPVLDREALRVLITLEQGEDPAADL